MRQIVKILLWTGIFAIAMAFLESAVVVYLRALYYPEGFEFPLKMMNQNIIVTEIFREAATMIMLLTISIISVKSLISRFAVFIYVFAIWDIFYYLWLVILLGWPPSLFTWDLLFLIPVTWVGPVVAPVINSLTMIFLAVIILIYRKDDETFHLVFLEWALLITGSFLMIYVYTRPYMSYILDRYPISKMIHYLQDKNLSSYAVNFRPVTFSWSLYFAGQFMFFWSIINMMMRVRRK
ncbi:MAG: hypothetical protein ABSD71_13120 [Bacteroidales bacterium]|jgi:hypothetical protein